MYVYGWLNTLMYANILQAGELLLRSNDLMNQAFGGTIPAMFYLYIDPATNTRKKILMQEAVDTGLIPNYMNTYQVLKSLHPNFNPDGFAMYYIAHIIRMNYTPVRDIAGGREFIKDQDFIDAITKEFNLSKDISYIYTELNQINLDSIRLARQRGEEIPIPVAQTDVYDFIGRAFIEGRWELFNALVEHPDVNKLYVSIIMDDIVQVKQYLGYYDPRDDKHKAYFMAVEGGNQQIIDMIKDNIIQRNLVEQEAVKIRMEELAGETDLPQTIHTYARRAFQ